MVDTKGMLSPTRRIRTNHERYQYFSPKVKSVCLMSLALGVYFCGYELSRNSVLAMFTSKQTGFSNSSALPFAVGCVSPFSMILLSTYTKTLDKEGPRKALWKSTLSCSTVSFFCAALLQHINAQDFLKLSTYHSISKGIIFFLFVYQNSNVQLLYTQYWSFISSVLSPKEGAVWFAPIAGIGSITSTIAAASVSYMVDRLGLVGLLFSSSIIILLGGCLSDLAYKIAHQNGFEPVHENKIENETTETEKEMNKKVDSSGTNHKYKNKLSTLQQTLHLFKRVPQLKALFFEVLISQFFSSLLNFLFITKVKMSITDDNDRAGWTANCYAWINGISGILQFFVLPVSIKRMNPKHIWLFMPSIMAVLTFSQYIVRNGSLFLVAATFSCMKTLEYSLRGAVTEMLYSSLDYESRFIGKEIIGLFANRFGKSAMAIGLSIATSWNESEHSLTNSLHVLANFVVCVWFASTVRLITVIESKNDKHREKNCQ